MAKIKVGGGLGFVMLLVVVLVVMLIASKAWKEAAPTVIQLNGEKNVKTVIADHGQPEAREALGTLPNLNDMRQSTGAHAEELSKALAETE